MPTVEQLELLREPLLAGASLRDAAANARIDFNLVEIWRQDPAVADQLEEWQATGRIENLALLKRAAIGRTIIVTTTEKLPGGRERTRTVTREERDWKAGAWLHEHTNQPKPYTSPGRPSGLTPAMLDQLEACYRRNPKHEPAAAACGIGQSTLLHWWARGAAYRDYLLEGDLGDADPATRRLYHAGQALWDTDRQAALTIVALLDDRVERPEDEPYLELVLRCGAARAAIEYDLSDSILRGALNDPNVALKALRLLYAPRYNERVELTGRDGGPIQTETVDLEAKKADTYELLDRVAEAAQRAEQ